MASHVIHTAFVTSADTIANVWCAKILSAGQPALHQKREARDSHQVGDRPRDQRFPHNHRREQHRKASVKFS
jgi:hypothetical protein